ncbi:MAG: methylmalonyl Co-A mutase-associated GTPase MeaB [Acidimicrobiales bacterium]
MSPVSPEPQSKRAPAGRWDRERIDVAGLLGDARKGDRAALARLVSAVERGGAPARQVGRLAFPLGGEAYSVGITGAPGVGKSTLVDRLITRLRAAGQEVGVLAVDPSSPFSGGALLGDRVRMQAHVLDQGVFIRSLATRGHLGGLSLAVPEVIRVLDAAGLGLILVETVGVGQVEVEVAGVTDTTLVVLNPGSGDGVQANKAGLLEVADVFVINKADRPGASELRRDIATMLALSTKPSQGPGPAHGHWNVPIVDTVASTGDGVEGVWEAIAAHRAFLADSGELDIRRRAHLEAELGRIVARRLEQGAQRLVAGPALDLVRAELAERRLSPYDAADAVLAGLGFDT